VRSLSGQATIATTVEALLPNDDITNPVMIAHDGLPPGGTVWRPGMGVGGTVTVGGLQAPLAVRTRALQRFRDFTVVYARVGDTYEVRMRELGRRTPEWTEVLGGLSPGEVYVSDNAFLIRADIEKSGASHDH
jgi:cobalt-zinc-cadmium efflux system membrane fusion protein